MRFVSSVLLSVILVGCGGGGGYSNTPPTSPPGNNPPPAPAPGPPVSAASIQLTATGDGYGTTVYAFNPTTVTLARNGTVTWLNATGTAHNITFNQASGVPANVPDFASGEASRTFGTAGSFDYRCTIHAGMNGTVIVQ
jgi:plastocyanin